MSSEREQINTILKGILSNVKGKELSGEEVVEELKIQLRDAGISANVDVIGGHICISNESEVQEESECNQNGEPCDCLVCRFKKIIDEHFSIDAIEDRDDYKLATKKLVEMLGNDLGKWIDALAGIRHKKNDAIKALSEVIRDIDMSKIAECVIKENINRLVKDGAKL
jgi:hypothetical protein